MKKCFKNYVPIKTMIHGFVTIVFLFPTSTLQSGMRSDSDEVTLNKTNAPLDSVIGDIEAQSGCTIEYDDQLVEREKVTVHVHRVSVNKALKEILVNNPDATRKLRALWTLHVTRGLEEKDLLDLLGNENEYVRGWAIQILMEDENPSDAALQRFAELAVSDKSQLVRLYLTSALERIDPAKRWKIIC